MKLESISPLTTNSSSELYLFKNTSIEEVKALLDAINDKDMEPRIEEVKSLGDALGRFNDDYESYNWIEPEIRWAFEDPDNKGFVWVHEGDNRMASWQHWNKKWCQEVEPDIEEAISKLQEFFEDHKVTQQHLG